MWPVSTFEKRKKGKTFFVSTFLDCYKDIIYIPIKHKILDDLGLYAAKVVCVGGKNMYFDCGEEVVKKAKLGTVCPLA